MATDPTPLSPEELRRIYRTLIRPLLFGGTGPDDPTPTLVLLGAQAGAGKSRTSARLVTEHPGTIVPLSGDDLRIFHPDYRRLIIEDPERAGAPLADATRAWVRDAIQEAIEDRRSLLLEGSFGDPEVTLATAERFREAGFHVRVVAIASPRALSVLTATSRYLRDRQAGAPARFTRLSAHDRGYDGTTQLINLVDGSTRADRVTILSRNGIVLHDSTDAVVGSPANASRALEAGRHPTEWGARSTMELLGELKQITAYAITSNNLTPAVADMLAEAHTLALEEVVPKLSVAADSPQAQFIRRALTEQSARLSRSRIESPSDTPLDAPRSMPDRGLLDR